MQAVPGEDLEPGEVRLYWMRPPRHDGWEGHPLLDSRDRTAVGRVSNEEARALRAAARVLLRLALSRCADVPPAAWRFEEAPGGRPRIAGKECRLGLSFGISHTPGIAVCAVAGAGDVGVDVEAEDRPVPALSLARRFFDRREAAAVGALDPPARERRMLATWLCAEAAVKAAGLGIAAGLSRWVADRDAFGPMELRLIRLAPGHRVAVALRGAGTARLRVRLRGALEPPGG